MEVVEEVKVFIDIGGAPLLGMVEGLGVAVSED